MNQVKNNIIDKINMLDDINLINAIDNVLNNLNLPEIKRLNASEKELINIGLKNYKDGKVIDDADIRIEEEKWLNE